MTGPLSVDVAVRRGPLDLRVALEVAAGEVVALVGPNGAGKTTLLQLIAGLLTPDQGRIALGGQVMFDGATGVVVPAAERRVGVVFQDYLLFDHMSVADNVGFGLRSQGVARATAAASARRWLEVVGLQEVAGRRPAQLSGGQRQRVAVVRALASRPGCLLLDEPLAAMDTGSRGALRRLLRQHTVEFEGPTVIITHEPVEALALADRLVVVEHGRVTQTGQPADVARRPRSQWVGSLLGLNVFGGRCDAGGVVSLDGGGTVIVAGTRLQGPVLVTVHPHSVSLHRTRPSGSFRNVVSGTVGDIEMVGAQVRVTVQSSPVVVAEVTTAALAELGLRAGDAVWAAFKASEVEAYVR